MTLTPEEIQQLQKREAALRKALLFYADKNNWVMDGGVYTLVDLDTEDGMADLGPGRTAREVLARYPEAKEKE